ncbi:MAG: hypothetical protein U1C97_01335, partial [Candidatus Gracilibacteria bacterium]|nr:hypothetical protein [Candidatus Gracilibacteria bacterium]
GFDFIPTEPVNWVQNSYYYETKIDGLRYVYIAKYNRFLVDTGSPALPPSIDAFSVSVKNGKMEKPEQDLNDYASISLYELPEKVYDGFVKYLKQKETPAASPAAG